jgi:hypothetical protein
LNDWYLVGGGDGFQPRIDPEDPNTVYATSQFCGLNRLDLRTAQTRGIRPNTFSAGDAPTQPVGAPAGGGRGGGRGGTERVNWDCAYMISPHSHTRLYIGGEKVYRSDDRGDSWTPISPNLTRDLDPRVIPIMGKVWDPATTVSYNRSTTQLSTIVSIDESPLLEGLIYIGTDDGPFVGGGWYGARPTNSRALRSARRRRASAIRTSFMSIGSSARDFKPCVRSDARDVKIHHGRPADEPQQPLVGRSGPRERQPCSWAASRHVLHRRRRPYWMAMTGLRWHKCATSHSEARGDLVIVRQPRDLPLTTTALRSDADMAAEAAAADPTTCAYNEYRPPRPRRRW